MIDEEMAEDYANEYVPLIAPIDDKFYILTKEDIVKILRDCSIDSYLDGLKAGKPRWHKVADEGLPSDSSGQTYVVIDAYNCCALASFDNGTWHNYRNIENVVAWCEIPKYKEE